MGQEHRRQRDGDDPGIGEPHCRAPARVELEDDVAVTDERARAGAPG
jgi:hypothetical protein